MPLHIVIPILFLFLYLPLPSFPLPTYSLSELIGPRIEFSPESHLPSPRSDFCLLELDSFSTSTAWGAGDDENDNENTMGILLFGGSSPSFNDSDLSSSDSSDVWLLVGSSLSSSSSSSWKWHHLTSLLMVVDDNDSPVPFRWSSLSCFELPVLPWDSTPQPRSLLFLTFGLINDDAPTNILQGIPTDSLLLLASSSPPPSSSSLPISDLATVVSEDADVTVLNGGGGDNLLLSRPGRLVGSSTVVVRGDEVLLFAFVYVFGGYVGDSGPAYSYGEGVVNDLFRGGIDDDAVSFDWDHVSGTSEVNSVGFYGEKNEVSSSIRTYPPARCDAAAWGSSSDSSGAQQQQQHNLYLFGGRRTIGDDVGQGGGAFNDVWKFMGVLGLWVWIGGEKGTGNHPGESGDGDVDSALAMVPSSRFMAYSWSEGSSFYLVGGAANQLNPEGSRIDPTDVWRFYGDTQQWRKLSASSSSFPTDFASGYGGRAAGSLLFFGKSRTIDDDITIDVPSNNVWPFLGFSCWSHFWQDDDACLSRGKCTGPDHCECNAGFRGDRCTIDSRISIQTLTISLGASVGVLVCCVAGIVVIICYVHISRKAAEWHKVLRDEDEIKQDQQEDQDDDIMEMQVWNDDEDGVQKAEIGFAQPDEDELVSYGCYDIDDGEEGAEGESEGEGEYEVVYLDMIDGQLYEPGTYEVDGEIEWVDEVVVIDEEDDDQQYYL